MFLNGFKCLIFIALFLLSAAGYATDKPQVLATIKPLALIAETIAGPDVEVHTLLPATATPHHFTLRASDMRRMTQAHIVLWVGPGFEIALQKSLAAHQTLTASRVEGLTWPSLSDQHTGHHHAGKDWHLWLNPQNAGFIAKALADELSAIVPNKAAQFQTRAALFQQQLNALTLEVKRLLLPIKNQKMAVYHDAYGHFFETYGLSQVAYFTAADERPLGARHKYEMEQQIKSGQCLLVNPFEDMPKAGEYAKKASLKVAQVDPLGREASSYDELILAITKAILACHLVV